MNSKFWHTIQFKIIMTLGLIFLIISTILIFFGFQVYQKGLITTLINSAINLNESIESSLEMAMLTGNQEQIQQSIEKISDDEHITGLFITNKKGTIKAASNKLTIGNTLDLQNPSCHICHATKPSQRKKSIIFINDEGTRILRTVRPIFNKPACYDCHDQNTKINGTLFLDYSLASFDKQLTYYKSRIILFMGGMILALAGLTFFLLNQLIVRRIKNLILQIKSIDSNNFQQSINTDNKDEFMILADTLNDLNVRIQDSFHKIRKDRDYLQNIINSVEDGLIVIDKNYKIVLANKAFLQFINEKNDKVLGAHCHLILANKLCKNVEARKECPTANVFKTGKFNQVIETYTNEDHKISVEISASPVFNEEGQIIQSIEIIRDITEKKLMESELIQSEKLALIGQLVAGVAHEINNPLAIIATHAEGLLYRIKESDYSLFKTESWIAEYLEKIDHYIYRCKSIIERLLTFSRPSNAISEVYDLNIIIEDTVQMVSHQAEKGGKNINLSLADSPVNIKCDPNQISQLILNLIVNSLDAIDNDGNINISVISKNRKIFLTIEDDGSGIDKKDIKNIFTLFFTTKESGKGTGLGLTICQRIIQEHKGTINVQSKKGYGSKVEIIFPEQNN